jgi:hypothetical protein
VFVLGVTIGDRTNSTTAPDSYVADRFSDSPDFPPFRSSERFPGGSGGSTEGNLAL